MLMITKQKRNMFCCLSLPGVFRENSRFLFKYKRENLPQKI